MRGRIIKGIAGFYYCYVEDGRTFECRAKGIFRKEGIKPLVGDEVELSIVDEGELVGNVDQILPRRAALRRPAVANVDQALIVVACREPEVNSLMVARLLAILEENHLPIALLFNKADLLAPQELEALVAPYLGCAKEVFSISALKGEGIGLLKDFLRGKTTVLVGPSGVGKSTLTNGLQGNVSMETGQVSKKLGRGKHTTRHSQIIPMGEESFLVDTPGFTSLELPRMEPASLQQLIPEFAPYLGTCYFSPCFHEHEPSCGVKQAVQEGKIPSLRYETYLSLLGEVREQRRY